MKRVLLIARALIPSVTLCGHSQLTYLAERGRLEYRMCSPLKVNRRELLWADVLVFVRADDDMSLFLAETAGKMGKTCFYVLDDDLLAIPEGLDSSAHYGREETKELICRNMAECQVFLSPSRNLLKKYGQGFDQCVLIEEPAAAAVPAGEEHPGVVRIGFAGSIDRSEDINTILSGALCRVMEKYGGGVSVEFFGAKPALAEKPGFRWLPYEDSYEKYEKTMCSLGWDIGLAPMPDTPFHRCKHYNKYIEYASYGIPGIFSRVEPYTFAVRQGENGLLCPNREEDWFAAICRLVEDESLRKALGQECLREAGEVYSLEKTAEIWEQIIQELPGRDVKSGKAYLFSLRIIGRRYRWILRKLLAWGWKAPFKAAEKLGKRLKRK